MTYKTEARPLLEADDEETAIPQSLSRAPPRKDTWRIRLVFLILGFSLGLNCYYLIHERLLPQQYQQQQQQQQEDGNRCESKWAHSEPDKRVTAWNQGSKYTSKNISKADEAWENLMPDDGIIALDSAWAANQGLAQSTLIFPWDRSKSIYLLNSHHGFHCLNKIHRSLKQYRDGIPQTQTFEHMLHCLDWLRKDIICTADDTPLSTTNTLEPVLNLGAWRKCRDWDHMIDWARQHTACYRYGDNILEDAKPDQWDRFAHCPPGSPYLPAVRKHFGKPVDWIPQNATDLG